MVGSYRIGRITTFRINHFANHPVLYDRTFQLCCNVTGNVQRTLLQSSTHIAAVLLQCLAILPQYFTNTESGPKYGTSELKAILCAKINEKYKTQFLHVKFSFQENRICLREVSQYVHKPR